MQKFKDHPKETRVNVFLIGFPILDNESVCTPPAALLNAGLFIAKKIFGRTPTKPIPKKTRVLTETVHVIFFAGKVVLPLSTEERTFVASSLTPPLLLHYSHTNSQSVAVNISRQIQL